MSYSREQLYTALRNADKAGDEEAARQIAATISQLDQPAKAPPKKEDRYSPRNIVKGIGIGLGNIAEAAGETAGIVIDPIGQGLYKAAGVKKRYDTGQIVRESLGLPDDPNPVSSAASKGAVSLLGFGGAARGLSKLAKPGAVKEGLKVVGASPVRDAVAGATGMGASEYAKQQGVGPVGQVLAMLGGTVLGGGIAGSLGKRITNPAVRGPTADQKAIIDAGKANNVRVMTSDVKPPETFIGKNARSIGEKIPFAGTGGPRAAQQVQRKEAIKSALREFGGDDTVQLFDDTPSALDDVAKSLTAKRSSDLTRLTAQKTQAIARNSGAPVPVPSTIRAIDDQIAQLTQRGTKPALQVADELKTYRTALQGKTLDQLEAIRKDELANAFKGGTTLADIKSVGEKSMRKIYEAVNDDMGSYLAQNGGKADYMAWSSANKQLSAMAGELDAATFRGVLRNSDITPEKVGGLLFSKNKSDVARLYANLGPQGQQRAKAAIIQRAFDKAVSADGGLSPERFSNNLKALSSSIGVTFKGPDAERILGLKKLIDATRQGGVAEAMPPTGVQGLPAIIGYSLATVFEKAAIPVAAAGGLFARAYESPVMRDILLKLARAKPGTGAEAKLFQRASVEITELLAKDAGKTTARTIANDVGPMRAAADDEGLSGGSVTYDPAEWDEQGRYKGN